MKITFAFLLSLTLFTFFSCSTKTKPLPLEGQIKGYGTYTWHGQQGSGDVVRRYDVTTVMDSIKKEVVLKFDTLYGAVLYNYAMDSVTKKVKLDSTGIPIVDYEHATYRIIANDSVVFVEPKPVLPPIKK